MNSCPRKNITALEKANEFKKYLDRTGASEAIANAMECLSNEPEVPENPIDYIRRQLAIRCGAAADPLVELKETMEKLAKLKKENLELRRRITRKFSLEAEARRRKQNQSSEKAAKEGKRN